MERRENRRFVSELRCMLRRNGEETGIEGTTINVSRSGALIRAARPAGRGSLPGPGEFVELELLLPSVQGQEQRCMACNAVALRTNLDNAGGIEVAVRFLRVEIRKSTEQAQELASVNFGGASDPVI